MQCLGTSLANTMAFAGRITPEDFYTDFIVGNRKYFMIVNRLFLFAAFSKFEDPGLCAERLIQLFAYRIS